MVGKGVQICYLWRGVVNFWGPVCNRAPPFTNCVRGWCASTVNFSEGSAVYHSGIAWVVYVRKFVRVMSLCTLSLICQLVRYALFFSFFMYFMYVVNNNYNYFTVLWKRMHEHAFLWHVKVSINTNENEDGWVCDRTFPSSPHRQPSSARLCEFCLLSKWFQFIMLIKTLLFFVHLRLQQKRTEKSSPVIKFTVLPFRHCYFESSNRCNVQNVRLQCRHRPTDDASTRWWRGSQQTGPANNDTFITSLATRSLSDK